VALSQFGGDGLDAGAGVGGIAAECRAMNAVGFINARLATEGAFSSIGGDALLAQVPRILTTPFPQGCRIDMQPHTLLAHGFDDKMYVRMRLVRM